MQARPPHIAHRTRAAGVAARRRARLVARALLRGRQRLGACLPAAAFLALGACGGTAPANVATPTAHLSTIPAAGTASAPRLLDWPEFGLNPQRSNVSQRATGISAANVARLRRASVTLPGTVDSSPIYLHGALAGGARHDVFFVT